MKKILIKIILFISVVFLFNSCNDPIFFIIHKETPILKPLIPGSPTNFVIFKNDMYVASGKKIYIYRKDSKQWSEWIEMNDFVMSLAATDTSLYALYLNNNTGRIKQFVDNSVLDVNSVDSLYSLDNCLFINNRVNNTEYSISFRKEGNSTFKQIPGTTSNFVLKGVASDATYYYFCVFDNIYYIPKADIETGTVTNMTKIDNISKFTGIINLNGTHVAVINDNGILYEINNATIRQAAKFSDSFYTTGMLAVWYRNSSDTKPSLLLIGRQEKVFTTQTVYTNGYVEMALDSTGKISGTSFGEPGKNQLSSISNNDSYVSSMGKQPINHMMQAPHDIDSRMTLFASTQQNGVWSYKDRGDGDGELWNAER